MRGIALIGVCFVVAMLAAPVALAETDGEPTAYDLVAGALRSAGIEV